MKTITVFLASSNELNNDRNSFQALIAKLDDIYEPRGIRIKCRRWEDFPAYCTGERTQDVYNQTVRSCDMCICLFHKEAGQYTLEEFNQALDAYQVSHTRPKTFVYIRALVEGEVETGELKAFKDELFQSIGHYWCNYACDDAMNLHFVMQLERLMPDMGLAAGDSSQLQVEEGKVTLQGVKIADYTHLPFAAANHEYSSLKEKYAQLDKDITQLRALGIADTHDLLREKVIDRQKCHEQIINMEKQLLDMAFLVNKSISSNSPMSERKRLAIEMFEQGNIKGVINVLNEEDMASEAKQAELEIARGRQLVESGNELIAKGIQTIQSQVEDYILRAKALMLDIDNSDRFSFACNAYERAVELTRNHLSQAELADRLDDYCCFLYENNQFTKCEAYMEVCMSVRADLCREHPETYEPDLADSYNKFGILYSDTQRFQESEEMYKLALDIHERLAKANPQAYETALADSYNNLGNLYYATQRFHESEAMYKSALAIRERLAKANPQASESVLADSYNNLAVLYKDTQRFQESEEMQKLALAIYERLAKANPQAYEPALAASYNNLAVLYSDTQRFQESEEMYKLALAICERLAKANPQAYEPALARSYNNLAILYSYTQRLQESGSMHKSALAIYERLAKANPQAYEPALANSYNNLANLYSDTQRFQESEAIYKSALAIRERLAKVNPQAYEPDLAASYYNLGILYSDTQRLQESEEMYNLALAIRERLAKANPQAYEPDLAGSYNNLAIVYYGTERIQECEEMFKSALAIYEHLAEDDPQVYGSDLARTYSNLAIVYNETQRFAESEEMANAAAAIRERLGIE